MEGTGGADGNNLSLSRRIKDKEQFLMEENGA